MPRLNSAAELFAAVTGLELYLPTTGTFGSSTTSGNAAVAATSLSLGAYTNFADDDYVLISGDGGVELNQVDGTPAGSLPLEYKLGKAQTAGATVIEMTKASLGKIEQGGVTIGSSFTQTAIFSAQDTSAIGYFPGEGEITFSFSLLGLNGPNIALSFGAESSEIGAGTTADPYITALSGSDIGALTEAVIRLVGTRFDGDAFHIDLCDIKIEGGGQTQFGRQSAGGIPVSGKATALYFRHPVV
jgi:hypothetical protein